MSCPVELHGPWEQISESEDLGELKDEDDKDNDEEEPSKYLGQ